MFIANQIEIEHVERQTENYRVAAFNYWLQGKTKQNFEQYCITLGLNKKKSVVLTAKQKEKFRKKADDIADKIMRAQGKGKYSEKII